MGKCYKCDHDCTKFDPCPCCESNKLYDRGGRR